MDKTFETDELIIVGSRYGDLADILEPYYEKAQPIAPEEYWM